MSDQFNILDYTDGPLLATGQIIDRTPTGRTTKDDGGFQRGIPGSKLDNEYIILTTGQYAGTSTVTVNAINDSHSNECVYDKVTGLMWNRTATSAIYGGGANDLFWDNTAGVDEDIFEYCDQANISALSGYNDWRIPNINEIYSIITQAAGSDGVNSVAFPSLSGLTLWSSTSNYSIAIGNAMRLNITNATISNSGKTAARWKVLLCRLGIEQ